MESVEISAVTRKERGEKRYEGGSRQFGDAFWPSTGSALKDVPFPHQTSCRKPRGLPADDIHRAAETAKFGNPFLDPQVRKINDVKRKGALPRSLIYELLQQAAQLFELSLREIFQLRIRHFRRDRRNRGRDFLAFFCQHQVDHAAIVRTARAFQ